MKNYEVTGRVAGIASGVVKLSDEQAASRIHNLKDLGKGEYEIVNPIEFKNGELFGYSGDLPKVMASVVTKAGKLVKEAPAELVLGKTALKKKDKLTLFGMLPKNHKLDYEAGTKSDFVDAIMAARKD